MWKSGWREAVLEEAATQDWDLVVIGGGITEAGILREAVRHGLKALLLEGKDFAWGTSSRSSKLVHGGIRYLRQGRLGLTARSVRKRERLVREAPGLVDPMGFLLAVYSRKDKAVYASGLNFYDLIARRRGASLPRRPRLRLLRALPLEGGPARGFSLRRRQHRRRPHGAEALARGGRR